MDDRVLTHGGGTLGTRSGVVVGLRIAPGVGRCGRVARQHGGRDGFAEVGLVVDLDDREVAGDLGEFLRVGVGGDHPLGLAAFHAIAQVGGAEHHGGGDHGRAELGARKHGFPQLHLVTEHEDHAVTALHTLATQPRGKLRRPHGEIAVGPAGFGAVLFDDDESLAVCFFAVAERVEPVEGEVEVREPGPLELAVSGV